MFCRPPGDNQLAANIAGQILIGGLPASKRVIAGLLRVLVDYALQVCDKAGFRFPGELGHKGQIHVGPLANRDGKGFGSRVHMGDSMVPLNRPLGEHVRLGFELVVFVQDFQGTEQVIRIIPVKGQPVGPVVDKAVFLGVGVIHVVQFCLLGLDCAVRDILVHLQVD